MNVNRYKGGPAIDLSSVLEPTEPELTGNTTANGAKFVIFQIDDEFFGVPATSVTEVAHPLAVTALPNSPDWLSGLINLRGDIVAVARLRYRTGTERLTAKSKLIVFRPVRFDTPIAFVADKIAEIVSVADDAIETAADSNLIGLTRVNSNRVRLLDLDRLFDGFLV
jgi:purine-binding chemotaxis protein CheW